jgi:DNA-binding CsgD family transcriptional regulator
MNLPIMVFLGRRVVYANPAARDLETRLRQDHGTEIVVMLLNHIDALAPILSEVDTTTLVTAPNGETFAVQVRSLGTRRRRRVAVTVRGIGRELEAVRRRYRLTAREAEVLQLLLRGYRNKDIAITLGISAATVKRHLMRVFDKTGADSRTQLACRLA